MRRIRELHQVDHHQRPAGYRLLAAFEGDEPEAAAVAGFRRLTSLAWGDALYVDDLSTRAASGLATRRSSYSHGPRPPAPG